MCSFCTQEIESSPPATTISALPHRMDWAPMAMACSPDEQSRFTVTPGTSTGRPARKAAWRAMFSPARWACARSIR
ncbi:Uncharacterised protein [Bordetella pertussis]|nr:Uncharacterised protein [Bordetella pertussis]